KLEPSKHVEHLGQGPLIAAYLERNDAQAPVDGGRVFATVPDRDHTHAHTRRLAFHDDEQLTDGHLARASAHRTGSYSTEWTPTTEIPARAASPESTRDPAGSCRPCGGLVDVRRLGTPGA